MTGKYTRTDRRSIPRTLTLKLCKASKYLICNGISLEKTSAIKKSQVLFSGAFPSERYGTFLEVPRLSVCSLWYNPRQASYIPKATMDLAKRSVF